MQSTQPPTPCDHTSVGAIIRNRDTGEFLTFARATPPVGIAGPAGHIDDHGGPQAALVAEVCEETGLLVVSEELITTQYRPGSCRRPMGNLGHDWWLWEAEAEGELLPSARETRDARWRAPAELQRLAQRTIDYAHGTLRGYRPQDFEGEIGLEPVWVDWFVLAGAITVSVDDQWAVNQLLRSQR